MTSKFVLRAVAALKAPILMMRQDKVLPTASLVFALCLTSTASAQGGYSPRVGIEAPHSERSLTPRPAFSREAADTLPTSAAWEYPVVGALVGAGVGLTTAYIATHQRHVTDHSEDGLLYTYLFSFGAVVGLIGGMVVYTVAYVRSH